MDVPVYHLEKVVKVRQEGMEDFDGPLDLILHLLSKNKIEIRDISITLLLDQYLDWMEQRERLNLEVASEFVIMAAHLVYIKTRMLLSTRSEELRDRLLAEEGTLVTFTSASTVKGFVSTVGEDFPFDRITGVCIGEQTAAQARDYGIPVVVSERATINSMVEKISGMF